MEGAGGGRRQRGEEECGGYSEVGILSSRRGNTLGFEAQTGKNAGSVKSEHAAAAIHNENSKEYAGSWAQEAGSWEAGGYCRS